MIDTHAHLDFENFDKDREEVISRFFENGGKAIINIGVDLETSQKSVGFAEKYDRVFAAVGFHPEYFMEGDWGNWEDQVDELKKLAENEKVVAVGECGLDYFRIGPSASSREASRAGESGEIGKIREKQKKGFLAQIELAQELNLPVIAHCRDARDDLYDILKISKSSALGENTKFALHCYSGEKKDTEKFLELPNVHFSFSGNITYPKPTERAEKLAEAVRMIPLDRIMLDSDSPFLAPQMMRGKRNEPAYIRYISEKIAEIKGISVEEVERITDLNAIKFFGIGRLG